MSTSSGDDDTARRPIKPRSLTYFETHQSIWIVESVPEYFSVWKIGSANATSQHKLHEVGIVPFDVAFDLGFGYPRNILSVDCHGHGTCQKYELGYICQCIVGGYRHKFSI